MSKNIKIGIIGAGGYAGVNLLSILLRHQRAEVKWLISEPAHNGKKIAELYPHLNGQSGLVCQTLDDLDKNLDSINFVFLALPHGIAMDYVPNILKAGKKVVDLGADYRFNDVSVFNKWYKGTPHTSAELCKEAVFGLPELYRDEIKKAKLIGNPGCYPTASILGLAPLIKNNMIDLNAVFVDAKSGISGAGRSVNLKTHFCERNEGVLPYAVTTHRHMGEIEYQVSRLSGNPVGVTFVPHLMPMNRGILATIYAKLKAKSEKRKANELLNIYKEFYKEAPFVRVLEREPSTKYVMNTNYCDIGVAVNEANDSVIIMSAIDNLIKGAAGQAVQNMNLLLELKETDGLNQLAVFP